MKPEKQIKIYNQLKLELFAGGNEIKKLPGETFLARRFGVCRETVRGALDMLRRENIIRSSQGKRTEVNYLPIDVRSIMIVNISGDMLAKIIEENNLKVISLSQEEFDSLSYESFNALLLQHQVGGIIIHTSGLLGTEKCCELINSTPVPAFATLASQKDFKFIHCSGSYTLLPQWWQMALKYLREMGHCRIASFVPLNTGSFHGIKFEEYIDMLALCHADTRERYIFRRYPISNSKQEHNPTDYYSEIRNELERMMDLPEPPTAVLCYSNQWAELVYKAAGELKITIPDQLSVMGFVSAGVELTPELTTVEINASLPVREFISRIKDRPMSERYKSMVTPIPMCITPKASVRNLNL